MQSNRWVILAGLKVLLSNDFKTHCGLDASQNHRLINTSGNRDIAVIAFLPVQSMGIGFLPELLVIEHFKPFFNVVAVFKVLHVTIVPDLRFRSQEKSTEGCTTCL